MTLAGNRRTLARDARTLISSEALWPQLRFEAVCFALRLSFIDLEREFGLTKGSVSRYVTGKSGPPRAMWAISLVIADAVDLPAGDVCHALFPKSQASRPTRKARRIRERLLKYGGEGFVAGMQALNEREQEIAQQYVDLIRVNASTPSDDPL